MSFVLSSNALTPSDASGCGASLEGAAKTVTVGWRVLAILQFIAAGSLVLAFAFRVHLPFSAITFSKSHFKLATPNLHRTACVARPRQSRPVQLSRPRSLAVQPRIFTARASDDELSLSLSSHSAARAPPLRTQKARARMARGE
jgi:hypothetical protein